MARSDGYRCPLCRKPGCGLAPLQTGFDLRSVTARSNPNPIPDVKARVPLVTIPSPVALTGFKRPALPLVLVAGCQTCYLPPRADVPVSVIRVSPRPGPTAPLRGECTCTYPGAPLLQMSVAPYGLDVGLRPAPVPKPDGRVSYASGSPPNPIADQLPPVDGRANADRHPTKRVD